MKNLNKQQLLILTQLSLGVEVYLDEWDDILKPEDFESLEKIGYIGEYDGRYIITQIGETRIKNHALKESNLPSYVKYHQFPEAFDKVVASLSPTATDALLQSLLNHSNHLDDINAITKKNLAERFSKDEVNF